MKVTIFGWHHFEDFQFFDEYTKNNLKITWRCGHSAYEINTDEWKEVWSKCDQEDLVLIAGFGTMCSYWIDNIKFYEPYFSKIKRLAHWSFDNHHDIDEKYARKYFTHWLTAHTGYDEITGPNTIHLPCCYWQNSYINFKNIIKDIVPSKDVVFHHSRYTTGNRSDLTEKIIGYINDLNLTYDFSYIQGGPYCSQYTKSLEGCKVGLNISLLNDLNLRNFEVWMANKPLLTNYLPNYEMFPDLKEGTVFYNRDLSDFKDKLQESLEKKVDSRRYIIKNHMLTNRYLEAINLIMNSNFKINFPE